MNVERLLVYINPVVRYVTNCVLNYGYGTTSVGSRKPWSVDVFLCRKAAANWWLATTMKRTFLVCWRHSRTQWSHSELWILKYLTKTGRIFKLSLRNMLERRTNLSDERINLKIVITWQVLAFNIMMTILEVLHWILLYTDAPCFY